MLIKLQLYTPTAEASTATVGSAAALTPVTSLYHGHHLQLATPAVRLHPADPTPNTFWGSAQPVVRRGSHRSARGQLRALKLRARLQLALALTAGPGSCRYMCVCSCPLPLHDPGIYSWPLPPCACAPSALALTPACPGLYLLNPEASLRTPQPFQPLQIPYSAHQVLHSWWYEPQQPELSRQHGFLDPRPPQPPYWVPCTTRSRVTACPSMPPPTGEGLS